MLILIHGNDTIASRVYRDSIIAQFAAKYDQSGTAIVRLSGESLSWQTLAQEITSDGLFAQKKLVLAIDILSNKEVRDGLSEYLSDAIVPESTTFIIYESGIADKRTVVVKKLLKEKYSKEFSIKTEDEMLYAVREIAARLHVRMAHGAEQVLCARIGLDITRARTTMEKLASLKSEITPAIIAEHVERSFEDSIWEFVDTFSAGNKKRALYLLEEQLASGAEPLYILSMAIRQVRLLLALSGTTGDDTVIAQQLGLHPFVVKKTRAQARSFTTTRLVGMYNALARLDDALKSGKGDSKVLFTVLIDTVVK